MASGRKIKLSDLEMTSPRSTEIERGDQLSHTNLATNCARLLMDLQAVESLRPSLWIADGLRRSITSSRAHGRPAHIIQIRLGLNGVVESRLGAKGENEVAAADSRFEFQRRRQNEEVIICSTTRQAECVGAGSRHLDQATVGVNQWNIIICLPIAGIAEREASECVEVLRGCTPAVRHSPKRHRGGPSCPTRRAKVNVPGSCRVSARVVFPLASGRESNIVIGRSAAGGEFWPGKIATRFGGGAIKTVICRSTIASVMEISSVYSRRSEERRVGEERR